jgi:hypothetical protein
VGSALRVARCFPVDRQRFLDSVCFQALEYCIIVLLTDCKHAALTVLGCLGGGPLVGVGRQKVQCVAKLGAGLGAMDSVLWSSR